MKKQQEFGNLRTGRFPVEILLAGVLAGVLPMLLAGSTGNAQDKPSKIHIDKPTHKIVQLVEKANQDGYSLFHNKPSVWGGFLEKGYNWIPLFSLDLMQGKKYRLLVAGDFNAKDVDLRVKDESGAVVAVDVSLIPDTIVDYMPKATGKHTVEVRLYASANDVPCLVLAVVMEFKN